MTVTRIIAACLILLPLEWIALPAASTADPRTYRNRCILIWSASSLPLDALKLESITPQRIQGVPLSMNAVPRVRLEGSPESQNQGKGVTIVLVMTNQNRPAKLLAITTATGLLIEKFTTYNSTGGTAAQGNNVLIPVGGSLDLDSGNVSPPVSDADLRWRMQGTDTILEPVNGARLKALDVAIPVTARWMKSPHHTPDPTSNVETAFSKDVLQDLLAPDGTMNTIWRQQAGIFFFLYRLERCNYSLGDFLPERRRDWENGLIEYIPTPPRDCQSLFRRLNAAYNYRKVDGLSDYRGLDLYLWSQMGFADPLIGFGAKDRDVGPNSGEGAVWVSPGCFSRDCGVVLAHEAGHFLGLCHACVTATTPPDERGWCGFCPNSWETSPPPDEQPLAPCSPSQANLLMRDDAEKVTGADQLIPGQIERARKLALTHRLPVLGAGQP